jgi:hypothetical protein
MFSAGRGLAGLIDKEALKKRISNVEYRMSKEGILSFVKTAEQSESTLRDSAVRYSKFCGSLFKKTSKRHFGHSKDIDLRSLI